MKAVTNRLAYKVAEFLLTAGVLLLGGALARKSIYDTTGDEILRVHRFDEGGRKGVVIDGDTTWSIPKPAPTARLK